jgi:hypothetical protein
MKDLEVEKVENHDRCNVMRNMHIGSLIKPFSY